jgi:hypothetical protein
VYTFVLVPSEACLCSAARTSFTDSNLGQILDAFDAAQLAPSSVFVLWSDHGWQLGDNDLWAKVSFDGRDRTVSLVVVWWSRSDDGPLDLADDELRARCAHPNDDFRPRHPGGQTLTRARHGDGSLPDHRVARGAFRRASVSNQRRGKPEDCALHRRGGPLAAAERTDNALEAGEFDGRDRTVFLVP